MIKDLNSICQQKVFEKVYQKYAADLKRFLFFKTQNTTQAEDIMQDAFVKLWESCAKVNQEKAKSFLFTVANNNFLNKKKHEKVVQKYRHHHNGANVPLYWLANVLLLRFQTEPPKLYEQAPLHLPNHWLLNIARPGVIQQIFLT